MYQRSVRRNSKGKELFFVAAGLGHNLMMLSQAVGGVDIAEIQYNNLQSLVLLKGAPEIGKEKEVHLPGSVCFRYTGLQTFESSPRGSRKGF